MSTNIDVKITVSLPEINCEMINSDSKRLKKYAVVRFENRNQYIIVERETGNAILHFTGYENDNVWLGKKECYVVELLPPTWKHCLVCFDECGEIKISPEFKNVFNDHYENYIIVTSEDKGGYYCIDKDFNITPADDLYDLCIGEFRLRKMKGGKYTVGQAFKGEEDKWHYTSCLVIAWSDDGGMVFVNKNKLKQYINVNTKICSREYAEIQFLTVDYIVAKRLDNYEELLDAKTGKILCKAEKISEVDAEFVELVTADEIQFMRLSDKAIWKKESKRKKKETTKKAGGIVL